MIRLYRGSEPPALRQQRAFRLAEALLWPPRGGEAPQTEAGYGAPEVREALADAQHGLCAYCGSPIEARWYDIEHFRPRSRYWWLAWTWENLWVSCRTCQAKGSEFELEPGSAPLAPPTVDDSKSAFETWRERPLLLDPAVDQPYEHLRVRPDAQGRWW